MKTKLNISDFGLTSGKLMTIASCAGVVVSVMLASYVFETWRNVVVATVSGIFCYLAIQVVIFIKFPRS